MRQERQRDELVERFEQVVALLREVDMPTVWAAATEAERRVLIEELVDAVTVVPDHLEVTVGGRPRSTSCTAKLG